MKIINATETLAIVCGDINVTNEDEGTSTTENEVVSLGFTYFNLVAGDLTRIACNGTIEKKGLVHNEKI